MPHPKTKARYPEVQEFMNRAMESERGIRIPVDDEKTAFSLKMKVYAKKRDWRAAYIEMYEDDPNNPDRNRDPFQLIHPEPRKVNDQWYLYIHKQDPFTQQYVAKIEEL